MAVKIKKIPITERCFIIIRFSNNSLNSEVCNVFYKNDSVIKFESKLIEKYGANDYRSWKKTDTERYANFIRICVDNDIDIVRNKADYLICLWDEIVFKGAGTHAEVTIAYDLKKPVYLINKIPALELSGWIMACSTKIFESFDSLKLFLLDRYNQND